MPLDAPEDDEPNYKTAWKRAWLELDPWKNKRGKFRTWAGHLRVLSKQTGIPVSKLKERIGL